MIRLNPAVAVLVAASASLAVGAGDLAGQAHEHAHDHGHAHSAQDHEHPADQGHHDHAGGPVACELTTPPWAGLPVEDLQRIDRLQASIAHLSTPEAAREAGFRPALGNIPTMGVHWVNSERSRDGFQIEEPDHLMFAPVDGEDRLVGVAYAFTGPLYAETPHAFDSELAHWHDHPQLGGPGQTLHMIHVWTVPSPYGPFAGNNYLLPFLGAGIEPPNPCWIVEDEDVERFEQTAMTLALLQLAEDGDRLGIIGAIARDRPGVARMREARRESLEAELAALDEAARAGDRNGWAAATDRFLSERTPAQVQLAEVLRRGLTEVQLSSDQRDQVPGGFPGGFRGRMP